MMDKDPKDAVKQPDYIYVNDEEIPYRAEFESSYQGKQSASPLGSILSRDYPFFLRILSFFLGAFASLAAIILLVFTTLFALFVFLTGGQNPEFVANYKRFKKSLFKASVFGMGGLIATFSPRLGFGLIVLYFMIHNEEVNIPFVNLSGR